MSKRRELLPKDLGDATSDEYRAALEKGELPSQEAEKSNDEKVREAMTDYFFPELNLSDPDDPDAGKKDELREKIAENVKQGKFFDPVEVKGLPESSAYNEIQNEIVTLQTDPNLDDDVREKILKEYFGIAIYMENFRPKEQEASTGESLPEKKTAKLTLGGKPVEVAVSSDEPEKPAQPTQEEINAQRERAKIAFLDIMMGQESSQESEDVQKQKAEAHAARQAELDEQKKRAQKPPKPGSVVGPVSREEAEIQKQINQQMPPRAEAPPEPPESVDKEQMEAERREVEERKKQRAKKSKKTEASEEGQSTEVEPQETVAGERRRSSRRTERREDPSLEYLREIQEKIRAEDLKQIEIARPLKEFVIKTLEEDIYKKQQDFLLKWFEDHKDKLDLKGRGIASDLSDADKRTIAQENGAWTKLHTDKKYARERLEVLGLSDLREDFNKKNTPLESQFLMLNYLEEKANGLKAELGGLGKGAEADIKREAIVKELYRLLEIRKELVLKATGINVEIETEKELAADPEYSKTKDQYIEENSKETEQAYKDARDLEIDLVKKQGFGENYSAQDTQYALELIKLKTDADITEEQLCGLMKAGYDPRSIEDDNWKIARTAIKDTVKNFWNLGIVALVKYSKGGGLVSIKMGEKEELMMRNDFLKRVHERGENFKAGILEKTKQALGEKWENDHKSKRAEKVEQKIAEYASASNEARGKAVKGVEAVYKSIRDRLVNEYEQGREKEKSRKPESAPEAEKSEEPEEAKKEVKLTGNIKKDAKAIMEFLEETGQEDWGIDIGDIKNTDPKLYKEALKKQKKGGIIAVILHLFMGIQRRLQEELNPEKI